MRRVAVVKQLLLLTQLPRRPDRPAATGAGRAQADANVTTSDRPPHPHTNCYKLD